MLNTIQIKSCLSFLTINKKHLDRNFSFTIDRESNNHVVSLELNINSKYAAMISMKPKINDSCFVSIQTNNSKKILIFNGKIKELSYNKDQTIIKASYIALKDEMFHGTTTNVDTKTIISRFVPKFQFEASNPSNGRVVLNRSRAENLRKVLLLHKMNYFIDRDRNIIIVDQNYKRLSVNKYNINSCVKNVASDKITIFPIPELEIGDIVVYANQKFVVTGISYEVSSRVQMVLGVLSCP